VGGGAPGGSTYQLQVNNSNAFGAITNSPDGYVLASQGTSAFPGFQMEAVVDVFDYASGGKGTWASPWTSASGTGGIQEAMNALSSMIGGAVQLRPGVYAITSPISPPANYTPVVILQGQGWSSSVVAPFGNSQWTTANSVVGTVLLVSGSNDAVDLGCRTQGFIMRDLAIVGPGTGTSNGYSFPTSGSCGVGYNQADNVLIANFGTGWNLPQGVSNKFGYIAARGNGNGVSINGANTDLDITRLELQANTTAWNQLQGSGIHVHSGLVQANTNGLLIAPTIYAIAGLSLENIWFEDNTNYGMKFDATAGTINDIQIAHDRCSSGGDGIVFAGANSLARFTFDSDNFGCAGMTVPATAGSWVIQNSIWSGGSPTYASGTQAVEIGGANNGNIYFPGTNTGLIGPTGQAVITGDTSNNVNIGRYGSTAVNNFNAFSATFNLWDSGLHNQWWSFQSSATKTYVTAVEGTAASGSASSDVIWPDSTDHRWKMNNNNGGAQNVLGSNDWAVPGTIGATTPGAGYFTNLSASGHLNQSAAGNWGGSCTMSSGTSCTFSLSIGYTTPICIATVQSGTVIAGGCTVSGTTVTITAASSNSSTWGAMVFGNPN
jgi:hypothetical protein